MRPHGGHQISVRPLTKEERKKNNKNLLNAMKPYKKSILLASSFIVVSTLLSIFAPQWLSKLTDTITEGAAADDRPRKNRPHREYSHRVLRVRRFV